MQRWAGFQFPSYDLKAHDRAQVKNYFDRLKRKKLVLTGQRNRRAWLSFATKSRMIRTWFDHHLDHGTRSWDTVIYQALSVALVSGLGCRAGDVTLSNLYKQECLRYKHIAITIDAYVSDPETSIDITTLSMKVELHHCKGHEMSKNTPQVCFMKAISSASDHICPIRLLLTHALRHGLVVSSNLKAVQEDTAKRPGQQLQRLQPDHPVLDAMPDWFHLELAKPAIADQLLRTVKSMAMVSGILTRVYTHALRNGFARDVAHLDSGAVEGCTSDQVRQGLNHAHSFAVHSEKYVGPISTCLNSMRDANKHN